MGGGSVNVIPVGPATEDRPNSPAVLRSCGQRAGLNSHIAARSPNSPCHLCSLPGHGSCLLVGDCGTAVFPVRIAVFLDPLMNLSRWNRVSQEGFSYSASSLVVCRCLPYDWARVRGGRDDRRGARVNRWFRESNRSIVPASRGRAVEESPDSIGCGGG